MISNLLFILAGMSEPYELQTTVKKLNSSRLIKKEEEFSKNPGLPLGKKELCSIKDRWRATAKYF